MPNYISKDNFYLYQSVFKSNMIFFIYIQAVMLFLNSFIEHSSGTPSAIYFFVLFNLFKIACLKTERKKKAVSVFRTEEGVE